MTFVNPFSGRCVHGLDGAYLVKGVLENPNCSLCRAEKRIREAESSRQGE